MCSREYEGIIEEVKSAEGLTYKNLYYFGQYSWEY